MIKLTEGFLKHIKNWGITADSEPISLFFQHVDGTIITLSLKEIIENQEKVEKWDNLPTLRHEQEQEIKQLQERLQKKVIDAGVVSEKDIELFNKQVSKYHEEIDNLKQKIEKIKEAIISDEDPICPNCRDSRANKLKEILEEKPNQ